MLSSIWNRFYGEKNYDVIDTKEIYQNETEVYSKNNATSVEIPLNNIMLSENSLDLNLGKIYDNEDTFVIIESPLTSDNIIYKADDMKINHADPKDNHIQNKLDSNVDVISTTNNEYYSLSPDISEINLDNIFTSEESITSTTKNVDIISNYSIISDDVKECPTCFKDDQVEPVIISKCCSDMVTMLKSDVSNSVLFEPISRENFSGFCDPSEKLIQTNDKLNYKNNISNVSEIDLLIKSIISESKRVKNLIIKEANKVRETQLSCICVPVLYNKVITSTQNCLCLCGR